MRLKRLREQKGLTQEELGKIFHISQSAIGMYEQGRREPNREMLIQMADFFDVTTDELLDRPSDPGSIRSDYKKIPIYGRIVAGMPTDAIEEIEGYTQIPKKMAQCGEYFALRVFGESMEPTLYDGDVVIIKKQETVDSNQIAVVLLGDESTIKRVQIKPNGITLVGDNVSVYPPQFYTNEEVENMPILIQGHAVQVQRDL